MPTIVKSDWCHQNFMGDEVHTDLIRELASYYHLWDAKPIAHLKFREWAHTWINNGVFHWSRGFEWPWAILNSELQWNHWVLEAGGSWSALQFALAKRCRSVMNIDIDADSLLSSDVVARKFGIGNNIRTQQADLHYLPFEDGYFDRTYCISVVEHIPDWQPCIDELLRVTAKGGIMILTMDINLIPAPDAESYITIDVARDFVAELGGEWPLSGITGTVDGSVLGCLCLKIIND